MQKATFMEKLNYKYKYMKLPSGEADVFIYDFVEEKNTEDGGHEFIYNFNEFRTSNITEKEIKKNPLKYLDYVTENKSQVQAIEELQKEVQELKEEIETLKT